LFKEQRRLYDSSSAAGATYQQLLGVHNELVKTQKRAYDAETTRRTTIGIAIGVWALNFVDALLFFPEDHGTFTVGGISLEPIKQPGTLGLAVARKF
jgi:hypothetical protein